jgi:hypothetical protein
MLVILIMLIIYFLGFWIYLTKQIFIIYYFFLLNKSIGFKCPNNYNPAEDFIKILAISALEPDNSRERIKVYKYFLIILILFSFYQFF